MIVKYFILIAAYYFIHLASVNFPSFATRWDENTPTHEIQRIKIYFAILFNFGIGIVQVDVVRFSDAWQ